MSEAIKCTLCGCELSYTWCPMENAEVLLFLHGWGCDAKIFRYFTEKLAGQYSLLAVDFPGHGNSGEPQTPWGVGEYACQIRELLDLLKLDRVNIVAHSFGGRVALMLASRCPERVHRLLITGGAGLRAPASETESRKQKQYRRLKKAVGFIGKLPGLSHAAEVCGEKLIQRYGSPDYAKLNPNMRKTFVKVINEDLSGCLPAVHCPTLLVWGDQDTETPLWMGQKMEHEIPDAALIVFEGRGHFAFAEEAQRFLLILKAFMEGDAE